MTLIADYNSAYIIIITDKLKDNGLLTSITYYH